MPEYTSVARGPEETPDADYIKQGYEPGQWVTVELPSRAGGWFHPGGWEWNTYEAEILKVNHRSMIIKIIHHPHKGGKILKIKADRARVRAWVGF